MNQNIIKFFRISKIMKLEYVTWDEAENMCRQLAEKAEKFSPDMLVGISRGGLVPVRLLSDILDNRNVATIKIEFYKTLNKTSGLPRITQPLTADVKGKKVLIVDDVSDTGMSLQVAKDHVMRAGATEVKIATLHFKPKSTVEPDFFIAKTENWIVYPWEKNEVARDLKAKST